MIYTVGNIENYDKNLKSDILFKSKGGSVWKNYADILKYFNSCKGVVYIDEIEYNAAIYIVNAEWDNDVDVDVESDIYGLLNKSCKIIYKI